MNYYDMIRSWYNLDNTVSNAYVHGFNIGWRKEALTNNSKDMTPDEIWAEEEDLYQKTNYGQCAMNSFSSPTGSMNMSSEEYEAWKIRYRTSKEAWLDYWLTEASKGEEAGKAAYKQASETSKKDNKFQALKRIANSGSLKAAKAKRELNEKFPFWNML